MHRPKIRLGRDYYPKYKMKRRLLLSTNETVFIFLASNCTNLRLSIGYFPIETAKHASERASHEA